MASTMLELLRRSLLANKQINNTSVSEDTVPHKLLVANRGEIACRIILAAQALSIPTVAVYSDVDETAPHVAMADEKRRLGPARAQDSYLNQDAVFLAARETNSTLIHPGYGFLAENSGFAARCHRRQFRAWRSSLEVPIPRSVHGGWD